MTFPRIYKTTTEAALLKVSPRAMKECVSVLGIKFHNKGGRPRTVLHGGQAHNPFSIGAQA